MKQQTAMKLHIVSAALAATIAGLFLAMNVSAGGDNSLNVESASVAPGDRTTVDVTAEISGEPGLGAWTVDVIVQNPDQVTIIDCDAPSHSVCNPDYPGDLPTVRFAGATAAGLMGTIEIGTITVECADRAGSSVLSLDTTGFADATIGGPQEIAVTHNPGIIRCTEEAAGGTPRPSPTASVSGLPPSGFGPSQGSGSSGTLLAALAAAGLAALAGYSALRLRMRTR